MWLLDIWVCPGIVCKPCNFRRENQVLNFWTLLHFRRSRLSKLERLGDVSMGCDEDDHGEELRRAEEEEVSSGQLPAVVFWGYAYFNGEDQSLGPRHFLEVWYVWLYLQSISHCRHNTSKGNICTARGDQNNRIEKSDTQAIKMKSAKGSITPELVSLKRATPVVPCCAISTRNDHWIEELHCIISWVPCWSKVNMIPICHEAANNFADTGPCWVS